MVTFAAMYNPWKKIREKPVYDNPWISVTEHDVINPTGGEGIYGVVHFKNYAIGIIPLDDQLNTWIVGQYRYALDDYSWEIPMGGGPLELEVLKSAKRELKEETGLTAGQWTEIMRIHTSNSVTNELGFVFLAQGLTEGTTEFDPTEELKVEKKPFNSVLEMAMEGRITDSLSLAGIFKVARILDF